MKWQNYSLLISESTYDFIIVGSGSAGSVLANRLTEVRKWNVLLLEAGEGENFFAQVPLLAPAFQRTRYDWKYKMEYQPNFAMAMEDNILAYPRGKALGGTSVINYMIYTRGNPIDYDRWARNGNPGWSYREVLPYFLKSENATLRLADPNYHNTDGYLHVQDAYQSPLVDSFIESGKEMGYRQVDCSSPDQLGFATVQATMKNGRRQSVAKAFLSPVRRRRNLQISTSSMVTKILIDPKTRRAYGVEYMRNGRTYTAKASKEVILSAGTFNTPQLLMLTGIGPEKHLRELGIEMVYDLPVGLNMQDHLAFTGLVFTVNKDIALSPRTVLRREVFAEWMMNGTGPLACLGGVEGIAYIKTNVSKEPGPYPDVELIFVDGSLNSDFGFVNRRNMRIRDDVYKQLWGTLHQQSTWSIFPTLLHPKSIGRMKLRSKVPFHQPLFYGNYYTDSNGEDIKTMIEAVRFVMKLSKTKAFRKLNSRLHDVPVPGCEHHEYDSDQYWECAIRALSVSLHHQIGTVKMGRKDDPEAVVDPELRVYGVGGLRVADCSVIPFAIGAHTNAPCIMIGEKASDIIKRSWGM